ncbi:hypothetical protein ACVWZ1_002615 [Thermostichus sp. MS-CIW-25]
MVVQVKMRRLGYCSRQRDGVLSRQRDGVLSRQRDGVLEKPSNPLHYCSATLLLRNADAKTRPTV